MRYLGDYRGGGACNAWIQNSNPPPPEKFSHPQKKFSPPSKVSQHPPPPPTKISQPPPKKKTTSTPPPKYALGFYSFSLHNKNVLLGFLHIKLPRLRLPRFYQTGITGCLNNDRTIASKYTFIIN